MVNVTPPEELDYSSSDSMTATEIEEKRWYNPWMKTGLEKTDSNTLQTLLKTIKVKRNIINIFFILYKYHIVHYFYEIDVVDLNVNK